MTNSQRLAELRKKRKEEEKKSSSTSTSENKTYKNSDRLKKLRLERSIGLDTFEADLNSMGTTIQGIYDGWQTQDTMSKTKTTVEAMQARINAYQDYQKMFGGADLSELANSYKSVLDNWDNVSTMYSQYKDADSFNVAKKNAMFDEQFKGLSYKDVQSKLKEYATDSDEYKYLSGYTNYSDLNDYDEALKNATGDYKSKLQKIRNQYALDNKFDLYKGYTEAEDFGEKSQYWDGHSWATDNFTSARSAASKDHSIVYDKKSKTYYVYSDPLYEYVNDKNNARKNLTQGVMKGDYSKLGLEYSNKGYDKLTDEEIAVFNYIDATEGHDKAVEYLEEMSTTLTKRKYDKQTQDWNKAADSGVLADIGLSVATVPANIVGAMGNAFATVDEFIKGEEYNPYHRYRMVGNFATDTRGYISENIAEATEGVELFGQNVPSFLYDTGMSIGDTALGTLTTGKLYSVFAGTNAYQQKAKELVEAGEDESKVFYTALASGAAEMVFEYLSIDKLLKIKNVDSAASLIKNTLKQAGVEGSEELFTEIANIVSDSAIRGKSSELYQMYEDLKSKGYSTKEINTEIAKQVGGQIGWSFTGGALSGGVMGGGASAKSYSEMSSLGKGIKGNERTSDMLDIAGLTPQESEAYKAYTSYANKGINADNISNARLGNLYATTEEGTRNTLRSKKTSVEQKIEAVKTLDKLSKIVTENKAAKISKELTQNGVAEGNSVTSSGEKVDIAGIKLGEDTKVVTADGKEISLSDITPTQKDADLLAQAQLMSESDANLFIEQYDGQTDVSEYADSFNLVMEYAKHDFTQDTILENKGVLSNEQVSAIYGATVINQYKAKQSAIDKLNAKHGKAFTIQGKVDDSVIDYDNTGAEGKVAWNSLNSSQRKAITFMKGIAKGTGMSLRLISNGMELGINGAFEIRENTIILDIYAGMDKVEGTDFSDAIIPTASHEMTHWMKEKSPELYRKIDEFIFKSLMESSGLSEADILNQRRRQLEKNHPNENISDETVRDEVIARACEDMLAMSEEGKKIFNSLSESEQKTFVDKIKDIIQNLKNWVNDLLSQYKSNSPEAREMRKYQDRLNELSKMWDEMLISSISANQALQKEGITGEELAKSASEDVKYSHRNVEKGKKRYYNELNSLAMQWANSAGTEQGDYNSIYDSKSHKWCLAVADKNSDGGYRIVTIGNYKEVKELEQIYNAENESFDRYAETYESIKRTSDSDLWESPNREMFGRNSRATNPTQEGAKGNTSTENAEYVQSDNRKTSAEIKRSDRDTDTFSRIHEMQIELNELRKTLTEMQNSEDFKAAHDKLSEAIDNGNVDEGIKIYKEWQEKSGYAELSQRRDTLQLELENLRKSFNEEIADKALKKEKEAIAKSGLSEADYFRKQAVKEFGYTPYFYDAGYITPNGKMLNFSGEKGKHYGTRGQDHRAIGIIYENTEGTEALNRFVKDGNIRIMAESPGIDLSILAEPTTEQYSTIRKFIHEYANKEYFNVDLTDESGKVIGSLEYENKINPPRIINDIKHYYATGEIREQSNIDKFRYSDRDSDGNTLTKAQQSYFAESKVRDENGNLKVMYHGTPNATFTKFRSGTYFTEHKWYADRYQNRSASSLSYKKTADNPDTYAVYLDIKKPFDTRNPEEARIFNEEYFGHWGMGTPLMESGLPDWLDGGDLQEFLEEQGYDYDGLILDEGSVGGYGDEVINRGLSYVVFSPEQVKSVENKTPTNDSDYRFSMRENVEETKDLVAVHNLSEEKLLKSLQLGGLPMPSIAIIKAKEGHNTFGNISLVFNKETIDPQFMRSNKVYSGDAWTPTYPRVEHKVNDKAQKKIANRINNLVPEEVLRGLGGLHIDSYNLEQDLNRHNGNLVEMFRYNTALKYAFLAENGVQLELPNKFKPLGRYSNRDNDAIIRVAENVSEEKLRGITSGYTNEQIYEVEPEIRKAVNGYLQEKYKKLPKNALAKLISEDTMSIGQMFDLAIDALNYLTDGIEQEVDYYAARDLIDKTIDAQKYESWIKELFANIVEKEGIRNNKDMFTPSGNRRSFEALHYEHNLENVIKAMKEDGTKGIGSFGRGNIFGASTTEYGSIAEIKEDAQNRMKQIPEEKYEEIRKGFSERFFELAYSLPIHKDSFTATDSASTMLVEAVAKFKTKSGMANYLRNESKGWANYSDYVVDDLIQLVSEIRQMPVGYFEAKPQRAVGFDEVATAIIPDNSSDELKSKLNDNGVKFVEYENGNEESRLKALNSLEDVKFSDRDSEGNELSKEQIDFFANSKVRDSEGNLIPVYHGTYENFTIFDINKTANANIFGKGHYFTSSEQDAHNNYASGEGGDVKTKIDSLAYYYFEEMGYTEEDLYDNDHIEEWNKAYDKAEEFYESGKVMKVYLNITNPVYANNTTELYDKDGNFISARSIKGLKELGFDGIIDYHASEKFDFQHLDEGTAHFVVFDSNQIKLTTNTNPTPDTDIRFSDRDNVSVYDTMGETDRLIKENKQLKEDVERLKERLKLEKQITHGNYFNENQLEAVAAHIRNLAKSSYSKPNLVNLLKGVYSYIATSKDLNWQDMFAQCYDIASMVLEEARPITETNDYYKMILKDIHGSKISVNEGQKQNAKYRLDNKWHSKFFNRIKITDNAISLDTQWQEWASEYPDIFDAEISDADQLVELYYIYDSLKEGSEIVVEYDTEEQIRWLAREIYNQYWNVSPIRTTAEKYDKQIKLLNFKHREAMNQLRDSYKDRLKTQHETDKKKAAQLLKQIRDRKDKEIAEVKQKSKERMDAYKENAARKTKIQSITTKALSLSEWLLKNSKEKHIHESLKGPVANLLQAIDFSSKQLLGMRGGDYSGMPTRKDISLQKSLSQVKDMMLEASVGKEELIDLYGHDLDDDIKLLIESVDDIMRTVGDNEFILNKMTLSDLNTLDNMLKTIKQAVTQMNQFHSVHHAKGIASLGQEEIRYAEKLGNEKAYVEGSLKSGTMKMLKWTNSVPYYAFKRFGEAGKKIFEAFQDGWDKLSFNVKEVVDFTKKTYKSKEVKEWEKEVKTFDIPVPATDSEKENPNYKPQTQKVKMTTAQVMYLYLLNKRASAKAHLLGGGIVVSNIEIKKSEVISQPEGVLLEQSEINKIIKSLTSRQIAVADALSNFMNTVCSDWGNEVSMARFGYKAFGEPDYVPMQVDKDEISTADPAEKNNSLFKLLNMSFTKGLTEGANNRLVISSLFDVFAQHTSDMAKYNALALPVLDAFKWYNYKEIEYVGNEAKVRNTVKKSIGKAFGKDGQSYITTLLEDINGQNSLSRDKMSVRFFKNAKLASVGMNLRVVLLQPTSYFRASANIDNKYLIKALAHKPKIAYAEKYCGMALWKSLGYYDTNIQRGVAEQIKHAETGYDKLIEWSMKGASEADRLTLGYLWNASELEIRETRKDLKVGSEEFFFEVGKRLRDIIYSTQVVDSTLTRSEFMRSPDGRDKILSMFASEPTLAYNILQDAYIQTSLDARELGSKKAALKKNGKKIARALTAYTITNAVAALVESGFDVLRDDDDEEINIAEFMKLYLANFAADMSIVGKIPYLKDGLSILQGYSPSRSDIQWMQSAYYTLLGIRKHLEGEGNPVTTIKNGIKTFSYLSGLPFYNAYRDAMATLDKLDILSSEELEEMFKDLFGIE